jgi:methylmalonyl-CoA mutase N-terminal domain/subunit
MSRARNVEALTPVAAARSANLLERFVAAAHADCALGEIADVLRQEFGESEEPRIS